MSSEPVFTATCFCGSIQLTLHGLPEGTYLCHCLTCRKQVGTLFATQVKYPLSSVKFVRGEDVLTKYSRSEDIYDPETGITPNASFCSKCGSPVWCQGPEGLIIRYGLIDTDSEDVLKMLNGENEGAEGKMRDAWKPYREYFCKRKPEWAKEWTIEGGQQRQELSE